jgi:hypothetical protein
MNDALKSFAQIPAPKKQSAESIGPREKTKSYEYRPREPVVNSKEGYKPIDRVAARVIAPASDICKPPRGAPRFMSNKNIRESIMEVGGKFPDGEHGPLRVKRKLTEDGHVEEMVEAHSLAPLAADSLARDVKGGVNATQELLAKTQDVIAAVEYLSTQIKGPFAEYSEFVKAALAETREHRIALGMETRYLMNSLKDVRQFFLEADYEVQVRRLHEFIDLCERLEALKKSGFLDAVADTILKL